jgi:hypothetical protein
VKTKHKFLIIILLVSMVFVVLSSAAGDKSEELDEYSSIEVGLGLVLITSVFWAPLALALLMIPSRTRSRKG